MSRPLTLARRTALAATLTVAACVSALSPAAAAPKTARVDATAPAAAAGPSLAEDSPRGLVALAGLAVGTGVNARALVGQGETFEARGQRLWAHLTVANAGPETTVTTLWKHEGVARWSIDLTVGRSPAWRTWSRWTLNPRRDVGRWEVEVLDASGQHLGAVEFLVTPPPPTPGDAALPLAVRDIGC